MRFKLNEYKNMCMMVANLQINKQENNRSTVDDQSIFIAYLIECVI